MPGAPSESFPDDNGSLKYILPSWKRRRRRGRLRWGRKIKRRRWYRRREGDTEEGEEDGKKGGRRKIHSYRYSSQTIYICKNNDVRKFSKTFFLCGQPLQISTHAIFLFCQFPFTQYTFICQCQWWVLSFSYRRSTVEARTTEGGAWGV